MSIFSEVSCPITCYYIHIIWFSTAALYFDYALCQGIQISINSSNLESTLKSKCCWNAYRIKHLFTYYFYVAVAVLLIFFIIWTRVAVLGKYLIEVTKLFLAKVLPASPYCKYKSSMCVCWFNINYNNIDTILRNICICCYLDQCRCLTFIILRWFVFDIINCM